MPDPKNKAMEQLESLFRQLRHEPPDAEELAELQQRFSEEMTHLQLNVHATHRRERAFIANRRPGRKRSAASSKGSHHVTSTFLVIVSLLIIAAGFAMIILPAPGAFEMYTLFYFNEEDGFTLMDLISLIVVFAGIFMLVTAIYRKKHEEQV